MEEILLNENIYNGDNKNTTITNDEYVQDKEKDTDALTAKTRSTSSSDIINKYTLSSDSLEHNEEENNEKKKHKDNNENNILKYKNMLINGNKYYQNNQDMNSLNNLNKLDVFLENEKKMNAYENWNKLNKTYKLRKLLEYAFVYKQEYNLEEEKYNILILFIKDNLNKNKFNKIKDVEYDKKSGVVKGINGLYFNKINNNFTIKNYDNNINTTKKNIKNFS